MKLYESAEDYLESILILSKEQDGVHAVDIARKLGFTKASVSVALHKLEADKYISITPHGHVSLTEEGLKIAANVFERHQVISDLLIKLGVDKDVALEDACKIEHDLSDESFNAIKKALGK